MSALICAYLATLTVILSCIWGFVTLRRNAREGNSRKGVSLCRICGFAFRAPKDQPVCRCPQCDSLNERKRLQEI